MSVTNQTPLNSFSANGSTTVFNFSFRILDPYDLAVLIDDVPKTIGIDYSVSGVGESAGGSVSLFSAPASGAVVTIYRNTVPKRDTDYQYNGDLRAVTVNADFDRLWLALQERDLDARRALRVQVGNTTDQEIHASPSARARKAVVFDDYGNATVSDDDYNDQLANVTAQAAATANSAAQAAGSAVLAAGHAGSALDAYSFLQAYIEQVVMNIQFPLDLGLISDTTIYNHFDLGSV